MNKQQHQPSFVLWFILLGSFTVLSTTILPHLRSDGKVYYCDGSRFTTTAFSFIGNNGAGANTSRTRKVTRAIDTVAVATGFGSWINRDHPAKKAFRRKEWKLYAKTAKKRLNKNKRRPSTVEDAFGPTEDPYTDEIEEIDPDDVPGLKEIMRESDRAPGPIPHQPWRRGDTGGCEAPIAAEWRRIAEDIIYKSVSSVGGRVLDVTWYLTCVVVTLDEKVMPPHDPLKSSGPQIEIRDPSPPMYEDPNDPHPEDIWDDQEDVLHTKETEEERIERVEMRRKGWATKDKDDIASDPDEPHVADWLPGDDDPPQRNELTRDSLVLDRLYEHEQKETEVDKPFDIDEIFIDSAKLSTIAGAVMSALEDYEDELKILKRHELILTSPGASDVIETQKQFDAYRGFNVIVETQDPFKSNRVLRGKLVERNSMDVIISKKGRLVTIPLNFVKCVRLPPARREEGEPEVPF